jgi:hypothetical protein
MLSLVSRFVPGTLPVRENAERKSHAGAEAEQEERKLSVIRSAKQP